MVKKLLLGLALLIAGCAIASSPPAEPAERHIVKLYLDAACDLSRFVCTTLTVVPDVFFVDMPDDKTQAYFLGGTIYMGNHLDPNSIRAQGIFIHELTHHLQTYARRAEIDEDVPFTDYEMCMREAEAWGVYNEFVMRSGRPDLYKYDWYGWYPQCRELI